MNGLRMTSIQRGTDYTLRRIVDVPFDGRHVITVEFPHHEVKPYGLKVDLDLSKLTEKHNESM